MIDSISAASSTVRVSGPTQSSVHDSGMALARLTRPQVGLMPTTPQKCAGSRIEPPVSDPSEPKNMRAATPVADPDEEPPVTCRGFHGLRAWP